MNDEKLFNVGYIICLALLVCCFLLLIIAIYFDELFLIFYILVPGLPAIAISNGLLILHGRIET